MGVVYGTIGGLTDMARSPNLSEADWGLPTRKIKSWGIKAIQQKAIAGIVQGVQMDLGI